MRVALSVAVVLAGVGLAYGQDEPGPSFEHLKCLGPMIGTWRYEGPLLEDVPGIAEKGTKIVFQFSWRRILNKGVVEENWSIEYEGGTKLAGKALIGWNAEDKEIVYGGMDSIGGMSLGSVTFDPDAKSSTLTSRGIDSDGKETSFKGVVTKTGKDTLTWQAPERVGGIVEGASPVYTFKRVAQAKRKKPAK